MRRARTAGSMTSSSSILKLVDCYFFSPDSGFGMNVNRFRFLNSRKAKSLMIANLDRLTRFCYIEMISLATMMLPFA